DLAQLLPGLDVVGEAGEDRLELVGRLVDQAVLAEDLALGQVLLDELGVFLAERAADLHPRLAGGSGGGRSGAGGERRRGLRAHTGLVQVEGDAAGRRRGAEIQLLLDQLRLGRGALFARRRSGGALAARQDRKSVV